MMERIQSNDEDIAVKLVDDAKNESLYLISRKYAIVYKCNEKGMTAYSGFPDACTCPAYDHCKDRPQTCKHIQMWKQWFLDTGEFIQPDPVSTEVAMKAYELLYKRLEGQCQFVRFHQNAVGGVLQVLVRVSFEDWTNRALAGKVGGVIFRIHGDGVKIEPLV
jgi:hypothetical protein